MSSPRATRRADAAPELSLKATVTAQADEIVHMREFLPKKERIRQLEEDLARANATISKLREEVARKDREKERTRQ